MDEDIAVWQRSGRAREDSRAAARTREGRLWCEEIIWGRTSKEKEETPGASPGLLVGTSPGRYLRSPGRCVALSLPQAERCGVQDMDMDLHRSHC